jgi:hypothetical protein
MRLAPFRRSLIATGAPFIDIATAEPVMEAVRQDRRCERPRLVAGNNSLRPRALDIAALDHHRLDAGHGYALDREGRQLAANEWNFDH